MKITKRIAEAQYCYTEVQFDSIEEYQKEYKNVLKIYKEFAPLHEGANKLGDTIKPLNK